MSYSGERYCLAVICYAFVVQLIPCRCGLRQYEDQSDGVFSAGKAAVEFLDHLVVIGDSRRILFPGGASVKMRLDGQRRSGRTESSRRFCRFHEKIARCGFVNI